MQGGPTVKGQGGFRGQQGDHFRDIHLGGDKRFGGVGGAVAKFRGAGGSRLTSPWGQQGVRNTGHCWSRRAVVINQIQGEVVAHSEQRRKGDL